MPLTKLQFRPGINRETTSYTNEGGWFDCDKVRFRFGAPEKIGGWEKLSGTFYLGTCRALHPWVALDGSRFLGVGTHLKYSINEGGGYNDITPIRRTTSAGAVTFTPAFNTIAVDISDSDKTITLTSGTSFPEKGGLIKIDNEIIRYAERSGNDLTNCTRGAEGTVAASHLASADVACTTILVNDFTHGALVNDFVTFSGAASLGGNMTANILNQEYQIVEVEDNDKYHIEAREVDFIQTITVSGGIDPVFVFTNSSDTGTGGASVVGTYQINTGLDNTVVGNGWGAGTWSRGAWGSSTSLLAQGATLRLWSHDNFGEDLLINVRDGGIYYWDKTSGLSSRAVALNSLSGANTTPTVAKKVLVSDRDRHIIAFGCDSETNSGVQDPLLIRFSSQESLTDWAATATNTAGDLRLGSGSEIITAVETRQQVLVFTDVSLHAMQFLGPPFTFGINLISENITIAGPLAAVAVEDSVFWMGAEEFYVYSGTVTRIPCTVRDFVFGNINDGQLEKVTAGSNTAFSEIWWFYPSAGSDENDRYVIYNYEQKIWYYGELNRTVWLDRGVEPFPIAGSTGNQLLLHEAGFDDDSTTPPTPIAAYIESSQIDLADGDNFMFVRRLIPDLTFRNSTSLSPQATMTIKMRNFPGANYAQSFEQDVVKTATLPVEQYTEQIHLRLRGRSMTYRIDSDELGVAWRLGSPRLDIRPDGRR